MTEQQHPITPPPELVREWNEAAIGTHFPPYGYSEYIATQAARWGADQQLQLDAEQINQAWQKGADQELEACVNYVDTTMSGNKARALRAARRPKPPSLAEQALEALDQADKGLNESEWQQRSDTIRRALERLQELESNG